jgi:hypothetical protein
MKQLRVACAGLALALLTSCAAERTIVAKAPPPARVETPTRKPGSTVFWQPGHWAWDASKGLYYWEAGGWIPERTHELLIPGYWERVEEQGNVQGWAWVEPRWEPK